MKRMLMLILISALGAAGLIYLNLKTRVEPKVKPKVESWAHNRYHFVNMRSMTDEVYTMICDRHTGMESLLAKGYKRVEGGRDQIITMAQVGMGFNEDCLGRDVQACMNRGRQPAIVEHTPE